MDIQSITVDFIIGSPINDCVRQACTLAQIYKCKSKFNFNGVCMTALPTTQQSELMEYYYSCLADLNKE